MIYYVLWFKWSWNCSFKESELALIGAQQYYIEHGSNVVTSTLHNELPQYVPSRVLKQGGNAHWETLIADTIKKVYFIICLAVDKKWKVTNIYHIFN